MARDGPQRHKKKTMKLFITQFPLFACSVFPLNPNVYFSTIFLNTIILYIITGMLDILYGGGISAKFVFMWAKLNSIEKEECLNIVIQTNLPVFQGLLEN